MNTKFEVTGDSFSDQIFHIEIPRFFKKINKIKSFYSYVLANSNAPDYGFSLKLEYLNIISRNKHMFLIKALLF